MGEKDDSFKVVYNSDLIIRDQSEAATLCVFYDQVFLPYRRPNSTSDWSVVELGQEETQDYRRVVKDWEVTYGTLFDAGVLRRVPPPASPSAEYERVEFYERPKLLQSGHHEIDFVRTEHWGELQEEDRIISTNVEQYRMSEKALWGGGSRVLCDVRRYVVLRKKFSLKPTTLKSILSLPVHKQIDSGGKLCVNDDLVHHMLRTDIDMPQIFTTLEGRPGRDVLVALEAEATFSYLLPKLRVYHPTQIMELREKIADTREGFTMHLWKLSKGLEEHCREDVPVKEITRFANNLIETELIPDFKEFRRQLEAKGAGKWDKVLDAAGKVAEIDAAPWTPKFWALLLKAMGITLVSRWPKRRIPCLTSIRHSNS